MEIQTGAVFTFTTDEIEGDETRVSVNYKGLIKDLSVGDRILVNNGMVVFEVIELKGNDAICNTIIGGTLSNRKSMSFPNKVMSGPYLSEQDKADLLFGIENDVDYVAASFVSTQQDAMDVRNFLNAHGGQQIDIIAKIENQAGVDNIEEICEACEGIMIARGDLGVEIPFVEVPAVQKLLISKCRLLGKLVVSCKKHLWNFSGKASGKTDQSVAMPTQQLHIDTWLGIKSLCEAARDQIHQIPIACLVSTEQHQMIPRTYTGSLTLFKARRGCNVDLTANDRLNSLF